MKRIAVIERCDDCDKFVGPTWCRHGVYNGDCTVPGETCPLEPLAAHDEAVRVSVQSGCLVCAQCGAELLAMPAGDFTEIGAIVLNVIPCSCTRAATIDDVEEALLRIPENYQNFTYDQFRRIANRLKENK